MYMYLRILCLSILVVITSACGSMTKTLCPWCEISPEKYTTGKYFDYTKVNQIKLNMDVEQVIEILGTPYTVSSSLIDKQFIWSYTFGLATQTFVVQFLNGKVANTKANRTHKENSYGITY
jgi:outer membrane protein assembly factor BamE (lipoprotein component of BamABCDE complex)